MIHHGTGAVALHQLGSMYTDAQRNVLVKINETGGRNLRFRIYDLRLPKDGWVLDQGEKH
jgi:hypothetical protein